MKRKLTDTLVERVKPPPTGRAEYFDTVLPSFALRVTDKGSKSWVVMYRLPGNPTVKRKTLGKYPVRKLKEARNLAREFLQDPAAFLKAEREEAIASDALTFRKLADQYLERYAKRHKRTWASDSRILDRDFGTWMERSAADITRQDVVAAVELIIDRGAGYQANRSLATVRKVFNWAVAKGLLETTPVIKVAREPEKERERVLTDDEIAQLWPVWGSLAYPFGSLFKLLLVTGQRRGEVAGMEWSHLNLETAVWTLPETKSGRTHECPLSPMALAIIEALPRFESPYVFTTRRAPVSGFSKVKARIDEASGVTNWRIHDLRRTCGTGMARLGIADSTISRVFNHKEGGVTKIYKRYGYLAEKRTALDTWAERLQDIVEGKGAKIVALRG